MHMAPQDPRDGDLFIQMISGAESTPHNDDPLDDVFGSDSDSPVFEPQDRMEARESHPSDIQRLQTEHTTAGYREGITVAKAKSIQEGFDEGYSLGATIGLKAGQLLGFIEGIASALNAIGGDDGHRARRLLEEARKDLQIEKIFDEQYWAPDGTWKYEIGTASTDSDIVFEDVACAHPLISKWTRNVDAEVGRWNIRREILDLIQDVRPDGVSDTQGIKIEQKARKVLDW